jgi:hypothetical protein
MSDFPAPPTSNSSRFGWLRRRILKIPVWAWIVVVLVIGGVASAGSPSEQTSSPVKTTDAPTTDAPTTDAPTTDAPTTDAPTTDAPTTEAPEPSETIGQENARESAQNYLNAMSFSRSGLIDQLLFEGFSQADAEYGTDSMKADWNEQAALSAQNYLDSMSFSRSGLIDQLLFEGFSQAEAEYGVNAVGF